MADLFVVNAFNDLKIKSSGGGGFSDGGVINRSVALQESGQTPVVVEIAPPPGVNYGPVFTQNDQEINDAGPVVVNFDPTNPVNVEEYFVSADGTETLTDTSSVGGGGVQPVSPFFQASGVLQYPNKLKYKLAPGNLPSPSARVLLKYCLTEFDRPADQI